MLRLLALLPFLVAGCSSSDPGDDRPNLPAVGGLTVDATEESVQTVAGRLTAALEAADPVSIIADVDHAANAPDGSGLWATRVVLFGNPVLGTPLMQANPQAGLDLPQKMLVYDNGDGYAVVGYNSVDYLAARHDLSDLPELDQITDALALLAAEAVGDSVGAQTGAVSVTAGEGIVAVPSPDDVTVTYNRLRRAIGDNAALSIVAELDHQSNAASVGLDLAPSRLIVFGNPALGTPLMQDEQTVAIDLPQKMLVYEGPAGAVFVLYNDPAYLARRHGLDDVDDETQRIATALENLAQAASGS
jgi:uncharacterized protein (DUF302 family)